VRAKAPVLVGLVFSAVLGYSMHTRPSESPIATATCTNSNPALERFCWHIDRAESTYAVIFKSRRPEGEGTDVVFRSTVEEALACRQELLEDPSGRYFDIRIGAVTPTPGQKP